MLPPRHAADAAMALLRMLFTLLITWLRARYAATSRHAIAITLRYAAASLRAF